VTLYRPRLFVGWWLVDYFLTALTIACLSSFQWASLCGLMRRIGK